MKRRFAEGNYRGALELAEQALEMNPDDAIAEAIATESRHEIERLRNVFAIHDSDAPGPGSSPKGGLPKPEGGPSWQQEEEQPQSSYLVEVDVDVDLDDDHPVDSIGRRSTAPPGSDVPASSQTRPTAPPGVSRTRSSIPVVHVAPNPPPRVDDLDDAWDSPASIRPRPLADETPSAEATVALKGKDLDAELAKLAAQPPGTALSPEAIDALAGRMYEEFVGHRYAAAIETAERILSHQPGERLALAIESQSRTALAREQAIVVLVVSRAEVAAAQLGAAARSVLSWVDGRRSVRDIASACGTSVGGTLSILDDLRVDGIVVLGGELDG